VRYRTEFARALKAVVTRSRASERNCEFADPAAAAESRSRSLRLPSMIAALASARMDAARERQIKHWTHGKKLALIDGDLGALKSLAKRRIR